MIASIRASLAPMVLASAPSLAWNTTLRSFSFHCSNDFLRSSAKKNRASDSRDAITYSLPRRTTAGSLTTVAIIVANWFASWPRPSCIAK